MALGGLKRSNDALSSSRDCMPVPWRIEDSIELNTMPKGLAREKCHSADLSAHFGPVAAPLRRQPH